MFQKIMKQHKRGSSLSSREKCRYTKRQLGSPPPPRGRSTVPTPDQEEEIGKYFVDIENRMYRLNLVDVRQLAFQYCELNSLKIHWTD